MEVADFLSIIGIIVSIVFGFFVTHFYSIKDARTRALKDYYIEQVKAIKIRIDEFFHAIAFGESSFKKTINWYDHLSIDIVGIDKGIRKSLDLQMVEFIDIIDGYYGEITKWEDFNDQFSDSNYRPSNAHIIRLKQMKYEIDEFLNDYIGHINESNNFPIWKVQYRRIKQSSTFYKEKGYNHPILRSLWERIEKHFFEGVAIMVLIVSVVYIFDRMEIEEKDDIVTPLNNISNKQDSIYREFQLFREKYRPVEIKSKTFNNSSFFNAQKVDSVHIKLYKGHDKE